MYYYIFNWIKCIANASFLVIRSTNRIFNTLLTMKLKEYYPTKTVHPVKNQRKIQYLDQNPPNKQITVTTVYRLQMGTGATIFQGRKTVYWRKTIGCGEAWMKMVAFEKENMLHKNPKMLLEF